MEIIRKKKKEVMEAIGSKGYVCSVNKSELKEILFLIEERLSVLKSKSYFKNKTEKDLISIEINKLSKMKKNIKEFLKEIN